MRLRHCSFMEKGWKDAFRLACRMRRYYGKADNPELPHRKLFRINTAMAAWVAGGLYRRAKNDRLRLFRAFAENLPTVGNSNNKKTGKD